MVSSVKHLSKHVNSDMSDNTDCDVKCSRFIGHVTKLKANFGYLHPIVQDNLFKILYCSFYGSSLWKYNSTSLKNMYSLPGTLMCALFLSHHTEHTLLFLAYNCSSLIIISEQLYIRSAHSLYNLYHSCNRTVQTRFTNCLYNSNSVIGSKIVYFRATYHINLTASTCSSAFI